MNEQTITDYSALIDAETWAFIRKSESWYPPETANYSIEKQREIYDALCQAFHRGHPHGVVTEDVAFGHVPCRKYELGPSPITLIYFHGGGFVVGGLNSHDDICAEICAATGYRVISVDYRLAPEYPHPAAFEDALAATQAIALAFDSPLILVGDSAGGNLAAAVSSHSRTTARPIIGQALVYPGLGGDLSKGSYIKHAHAPMLTLADMEFYSRIRFPGGIAQISDTTASPLVDGDFAGLPPTLVISAQCDPVCDDGQLYCAAIQAAGGLAHFHEEKGLVHGYLRARGSVTRAMVSFVRLTQGISALGRREFPWRVTL
ncbi:MAG: alpha/beta hydrolase [Albidovulum sp.]